MSAQDDFALEDYRGLEHLLDDMRMEIASSCGVHECHGCMPCSALRQSIDERAGRAMDAIQELQGFLTDCCLTAHGVRPGPNALTLAETLQSHKNRDETSR